MQKTTIREEFGIDLPSNPYLSTLNLKVDIEVVQKLGMRDRIARIDVNGYIDNLLMGKKYLSQKEINKIKDRLMWVIVSIDPSPSQISELIFGLKHCIEEVLSEKSLEYVYCKPTKWIELKEEDLMLIKSKLSLIKEIYDPSLNQNVYIYSFPAVYGDTVGITDAGFAPARAVKRILKKLKGGPNE